MHNVSLKEESTTGCYCVAATNIFLCMGAVRFDASRSEANNEIISCDTEVVQQKCQ
jgi:hypothetical protein